MIKLLLLCFCVYGALGSPVRTFEVFDDVLNEAEVIDAAEPLPGTHNLLEKRVPVIRLTIPAGYLGLYGNKNLAERAQVPYPLSSNLMLPGLRNLDEKAIPEAVIARMFRHPKSEVEKVNV